jgi:hypoxanthine phosphoribosyltransferase
MLGYRVTHDVQGHERNYSRFKPVRASAIESGTPMEVLIDRRRLASRVAELAQAIRRDAGAGQDVHLVAVLKGAFVFLADLMREMDGPVTCDFIAVSSYGAGARTSGEVQLLKDLDTRLAGRDVVIVEDIVDSGLTLLYLQGLLRARGPRSLKTACLLSKPARRLAAVTIDYVGFEIPDAFVVGYGLDLDERYRQLPDVCVAETP